MQLERDAADITREMTGLITPHPREPGRVEAFLPSPCPQNHAANLALLPDGTLACVWFGGTMEGMSDISVYVSRLAPGADRWSAAERLSDDPSRSEQNPVLFVAPNGAVWLIYTAQPGGRQDQAIIRYRISHDGGASFGPVARLGGFTGVFVRQPPVIAPSGDWLLPGFRCVGRPGRAWTGDEDTAVVLVSPDQGASWTAREVPGSLGAVHMNILPGTRMIALYRDRFAEHVRRSVSNDGGHTWSAAEPTDQPNNNSSIQAVRLADGRLAMVYNPASIATSDARRVSLYDEIEAAGAEAPAAPAAPSARPAVWGVPRAPLSLGFSDDDGRTFPVRRDIETGSGYCLTNNSKDGLNRELSYPSILQSPDATLHIAYTYHRRAIKYVRLT